MAPEAPPHRPTGSGDKHGSPLKPQIDPSGGSQNPKYKTQSAPLTRHIVRSRQKGVSCHQPSTVKRVTGAPPIDPKKSDGPKPPAALIARLPLHTTHYNRPSYNKNECQHR